MRRLHFKIMSRRIDPSRANQRAQLANQTRAKIGKIPPSAQNSKKVVGSILFPLCLCGFLSRFPGFLPQFKNV